jgi:uncharacterized iron-regulated membrane protein
MQLKKAIYNTHLILGLISGVIVFIVAITGCFYAFKAEIQEISQPYRDVPVQQSAFLSPSNLIDRARDKVPGRNLRTIIYGEQNDAVEVVFYESKPLFYKGVFMNPYSGEVLKVKNYKQDFFYIVFLGHFQLWLPRSIGKPIVSTAVLIFVVLLITGIVLWWPKKREERKRFLIQWKAPWKRRIFDMHSVLGFYAHILLLIIALTGLVWGFQWFAEAIYSTTGGKKELSFTVPKSDTTGTAKSESVEPVDYVWQQMNTEYPEAEEIAIYMPGADYAVFAYANPDKGTKWKSEYRYFDKHTLEEIEVKTIWGKNDEATVADKIRRMNYDIHTGAIGGLPGKILAFLASLVAASLPVTGFLLWWKKRKEKKKMESGLDL